MTLTPIKIVSALNDYGFDNNAQPVVDILNELLSDPDYKENLNLIFIAIATTQMYGFLSYLTNEEKELFYECDYFRSNSYKGKEIDYYNSGQLSFLCELEQEKKVFFSAPTSFGKTSIVTEFILNNYKTYKKILFVVPTNSLLEELFEKFSNYNNKLSLNYTVTTLPSLSLQERSIQFLTPERFMLVAENPFVMNRYDLIVMDETYKIVESHNERVSDFVNHRSLRFRKAADLIARANSKVIFLSPFTYTLTESMEAFLKRNQIKKIDRKLEYVKREIIKAVDSNDIKDVFKKKLQNYRKNSSISHKTGLILSELQKQSSIVYAQNYAKAYDIASKIEVNCLVKRTQRYEAFLEHIKKNFLVSGEEKWSVFEALKNGIGIYIAPLPRYVKKELVHLYEDKVLSVLIVTSAFTEGVNTCASNLIFTSLVNGPTKNRLSDIDVLNVAGRAGRFSKNTIGKVFCLKEEVFNQVSELQKKNDYKLENLNYKKQGQQIDFEIEMMEEEYLTDDQKSLLKQQEEEMEKLGLNTKDLSISLNVSNNWKLALYAHFCEKNENQINTAYSNVLSVYNQDEGCFISSLSFVFKDLREALLNKSINPFPLEEYDIPPFSENGEFRWGSLYQQYVSGSPKKIVESHMNYVKKLYKKVVSSNHFSDKREAKPFFEDKEASWLLRYYNDDLSININAFYTEAFKIVSTIFQYKIPFYLAFYVSIFKLFLKKKQKPDLNPNVFDINRLVTFFEDNESSEEYSRLIDCGLPFSVIEKMKSAKIDIDQLKNGKYDASLFDDYEIMIINETAKLC